YQGDLGFLFTSLNILKLVHKEIEYIYAILLHNADLLLFTEILHVYKDIFLCLIFLPLEVDYPHTTEIYLSMANSHISNNYLKLISASVNMISAFHLNVLYGIIRGTLDAEEEERLEFEGEDGVGLLCQVSKQACIAILEDEAHEGNQSRRLLAFQGDRLGHEKRKNY
ncbi:hypothetical protein ACJX0J_030113, partial [Zea mays]